MSMVIELISEINNNKLSIEQIVIKAFSMSKLLNLDDISNWLECKFYGYKDDFNVPEYRKLVGRVDQKHYNEILQTMIHPDGHNNCSLHFSIHDIVLYLNKSYELSMPNGYTNKMNPNTEFPHTSENLVQ